MSNPTLTSFEKRALVLAQLILSTEEVYQNAEEAEKGLLETLVGAAIWYLPNLPELFNQKISKAALASLEEKPTQTRLVEEHAIPRKVAGRLLYSKYLEDLKRDPHTLGRLYLDFFGRYNLVLKPENDRLRKYQRTAVFTTEEEAYKKADIELVDFSEAEYREYKRQVRMAPRSADWEEKKR
jgi:hypothetical protein